MQDSSSAVGREPRGHLRALAALSLTLVLIGWVYAPVVSIGPVAEDLQWAMRGVASEHHPGGILRPFHEHFRPAVAAYWAVAVQLFGDSWWGYRAVQLAGVLLMAALGWGLLRRLGHPVAVASSLVVMWLVSPLASEVPCVTSETIQVLFGIGVIGTLLAVASGRRRLAMLATALAALSKETWVVLAPLVFLLDVLVLDKSVRRALRDAAPWLLAAIGYVGLYRALVGAPATWFYDASVATVAAKLVTTLGALFHLLPLVPTGHESLVADNPVRAAAAVLAAFSLLGWMLYARHRRGLFGLAAAGLLLAPTLPSSLQSPRYTLLPWLMFLSACAAAYRAALGNERLQPWVRVAVTVLAISLVASGARDARRDIADWSRYGQLAARVADESRPLIAAAAEGRALWVARGDDDGPLRELLRTPMGQYKLYFPRQEDPYGVVSLSALLSWQTRHHGYVMVRREALPPDASYAVFRHDDGGFVPLAAVDPARSNGSVILQRMAIAEFDPRGFP